MTQILKFLFTLSIQLSFLLFCYDRALSFYQYYFQGNLHTIQSYIGTLGTFLSVYYLLMWKELYAHDTHPYLRIATIIFWKNISIAFLTVFATLCLYFILSPQFYLIFWKLIIFLGFATIILLFIYFVQHLWLSSLSKHGYFHKKVLTVEKSNAYFDTEKLFQDTGRTKEFSGNLIKRNGRWLLEKTEPFPTPDTVIEQQKDLAQMIYKNRIGELIIFLSRNLSEEDLEDLTLLCKENAIGYYLIPDLSILPKSGHWAEAVSYLPFILHYKTTRDDLFSISIKRLFDLLASSLILLTFLPIGLLISIAIVLDDWGPVFYISKRVGKDGKEIPFIKFRTMRVDAEQQKTTLLSQNERKGDGPLFKIKNDPRVTRVGKFLRRTNLDEFPQFLNVLLGHLSVIGPRPHLPEEVEHYNNQDFMRLECIPGITCLPQLRDRNLISFHEWIAFDLHYRKYWSLKIDFYIFWETGKLFIQSLFSKA